MNYDLLFEKLVPMMQEEKWALYQKVLKQRTRYLTVVLEDIYHTQNASAVMRTCDCFGVQDVHVIENNNAYQINPKIALGSTKWINLQRYNSEEHNTKAALNALKEKKYRIVATSPKQGSLSMHDLAVDKGPIALVFGNEEHGVSDEVLSVADEQIHIPMYGFTESFNISVSAALCLSHFIQKIRQKNIDFTLSMDEKNEICLDWIKKTMPKGPEVVQEVLHRFPEIHQK